jgi:enoyl-CoA hydratase
VERVVKREELREAALQIARSIASKSPGMIALAKEALNGIEDGNLEDKYRREQGLTLEAYRSLDSQEARDSFVEKRAAHFNG